MTAPITDLDDGLLDDGPPAAPVQSTVVTELRSNGTPVLAAPVGEDDRDDDTAAAVAGPHFATVYAFVAEFLVKVYPRQVREQDTAFKWCARWYLHPGALSRLEALWKAFEALRTDPGVGASIWWRDHADPVMAALTDPDGPFSRCGPGKHQAAPPLPVEDPPAWLVMTPASTAHQHQLSERSS
ncbi:MAG: DUF4913 domain-containing protein [Sporichthyaceae bacterium]